MMFVSIVGPRDDGADHRLLEREPRIRIELDGDRPGRDGVLQVVAEGLEDHVAGNVVAGVLLAVRRAAPEKGSSSVTSPMIADHAARQGDVRDLLAEVARPSTRSTRTMSPSKLTRGRMDSQPRGSGCPGRRRRGGTRGACRSCCRRRPSSALTSVVRSAEPILVGRLVGHACASSAGSMTSR